MADKRKGHQNITLWSAFTDKQIEVEIVFDIKLRIVGNTAFIINHVYI